MQVEGYSGIFTQEKLDAIFPKDRADNFFDALYGDMSEGAYDIGLVFRDATEDRIEFEFHLRQRPGKCLACNLTYGLPEVFTRHPIINIKGLVKEIDQLLNGQATCSDWQIGATREVSAELHILPISILLDA